MTILVVDDTDYKVEAVCEVVKEIDASAEVTVAKSFHSAVRAMRKITFDAMVLDMTLPTFDDVTNEKGGRNRLFGGKDVLAEMRFRKIVIPVIIVTQFEMFGEPPKAVEAKTLIRELVGKYPELVRGGVIFTNVTNKWRVELRQLLKGASER